MRKVPEIQVPEIQQELKARDETEEASAWDLEGGARREDKENQILELVFSKIGNLRGKTLTAPRWRKILPWIIQNPKTEPCLDLFLNF